MVSIQVWSPSSFLEGIVPSEVLGVQRERLEPRDAATPIRGQLVLPGWSVRAKQDGPERRFHHCYRLLRVEPLILRHQ